ncbi:MAG: class I SAM-dependent methyltransferase [bacterium]
MTHQYGEDYFLKNMQQGDRPALRWYAKVCCRLLGRNGCDILDYGCGTGWLMHYLLKYHKVIGYDSSAYCRAAACETAPGAIICDDIAALRKNSFDLITALHVLEHVSNPGDLIAMLVTLLKKGGYILLVVPALNGIGHRLKGKDWFAYRDPSHTSLLREDEWISLVNHAGLDATIIAGDGLWDPPYIRWIPRWLQFPIFGMLAGIQTYFGGGRLFIPSQWGECLIVAARKNVEVEI